MDAARALWKGWWIVGAAVILSLLAATVLTRRQTPLYRASTTLVVMPSPQMRDTGDVLRSLETLERRTVVATFSKIPAAPETRTAAAKGLGLDESALSRYRIQGSVVPNTNLIRIDVEGPQREVVAELANAVGEVTNTEARSLYRIYTMKTLARAVPPSRPIHPDKRRNYLVALVLGMLIGSGAALALPYLTLQLRRLR